MDFNEWKKSLGTTERNGLKDKNKAKQIIEKILLCPRCKKTMTWVENTNIVVCPNCTYKVGSGENEHVFNQTKTLNNDNVTFLRRNYSRYLSDIRNEEIENG